MSTFRPISFRAKHYGAISGLNDFMHPAGLNDFMRPNGAALNLGSEEKETALGRNRDGNFNSNENISNLALDVWELALSLDDVRELALLCSRSFVFQCNSRSDSSCTIKPYDKNGICLA
ncbi:hypothetical protein BHM03_00046206 [Ensete ventricosum]|nr:hypothetical protein BHM03_00046206 [Ensete ventricosum]